MKVVAIAGGTGSAKLLRGLAHAVGNITVVSNVGDNFWTHGLYVCPDVDIAMYTLAGVSDRARGWGIRGDTFNALERLKKLGEETWFQLGDQDLATHIVRTQMLKEHITLTEITAHLCGGLGVRQRILPATNDHMETHMLTPSGEIHIQEFWVQRRGRPSLKGVRYVGAAKARPSPEVREAIASAERVVVCPANPVTSVGPILAISGMRELVASSSAQFVAVSPMAGARPFSGPAGKLMKAMKVRGDSVGVAKLYSDWVDTLLIHSSDVEMKASIEREGIKCRVTDTGMKTSRDEVRLAREVLESS